MKFTTILAGAILALGVTASPNPVEKVVTTSTYTLTKYQPTYVTVTETLTKTSKVRVTMSETITKVRTKTIKYCASTASPTHSVYAKFAPKVARAAADQPLYAQEFA